MNPSSLELLRILPIILLSLGAIALLGLGAFRAGRETASLWALVILCAAMVALAAGLDFQGGGFGRLGAARPMILHDAFSIYFGCLFLLAGLLAVIALHHERRLDDDGYAEGLCLVFCVLVGMFLVAQARNLLLAYIGFELLSVPAFAMVAFRKGSARGAEGGLKYVVYGGASSGALLYGFSILYGLTGSLYYEDLRLAAEAGGFRNPAAIVAAVLIISGFYYKIAAAPFHWWCPDAYEGATPAVAGFLSVGPKAGGFAFLAVFSARAMGLYAGGTPGGAAPYWLSLLAMGSALSMIYGNLSAIPQRNTARLLAYSSIAHSGYILMGLATGTARGLFAALFYIGVYLLMNMGAFLVVSLAPGTEEPSRDAPSGGGEWIANLRGLRDRSPLLAAAMAVFLFSLTGLPPFGGFIGKLLLFDAGVRAGEWVLVILLAVNSVIALYYYARILRAMYLDEAPADEARASAADRLAQDREAAPAWGAFATLGLLVLGLVVLGLAFGPFYGAAEGAALSLQVSAPLMQMVAPHLQISIPAVSPAGE